MLFRFHPQIQIVIRESESFAIEGQRRQNQTTENTEGTKEPHADFFPRWRTTSYNITPAATETFSDGTLPSIGIETRKSHFRATRSWRPLPSAPRTMAQSML